MFSVFCVALVDMEVYVYAQDLDYYAAIVSNYVRILFVSRAAVAPMLILIILCMVITPHPPTSDRYFVWVITVSTFLCSSLN